MTKHQDMPPFRSELRVSFRQVADGMPFAIIEIDMRYDIVYANNSAFELVGINQSHIEDGLNIFKKRYRKLKS